MQRGGLERSNVLHALVQNARGRVARHAWLVLFLIAVTGYYAFVISAGHFTFWPDQGKDAAYFYDTQAEGFRAGHLYTTQRPNPKLLRVQNPYDVRNHALWSWDYSLYQGHLYLYWGLAPAALLALVKSLLGLETPVRDAVLVFAFLLGRLLAGCLLIRALAQRFRPSPPRWSVWVALLVFAIANPTPFLLARPAVYEAALSGGACFLTGALYFGVSWLFSEQPERKPARLAAASFCLGLAGTCRPSLLPTGAAVAVALVVAGLHLSGDLRWAVAFKRLRPSVVAAAMIPFTTLALAHLVVNQLRFGSWREFGAHYQLGIPFEMGPRFVAANFWNYLFHPLHHSCRFPFLIPRWREGFPLGQYLPSWLSPPDGYYSNEPLAGIVEAVPFTWLFGAPLLAYVVQRVRHTADARPPAERARWRWVWGCLTLATLMAAAPILMLFAASMRYEAEFMSSLLVSSALGGWVLLSLPRRRWGVWSARSIYCALALSSVLTGAAYGFSGYYGLFATENPKLYRSLQHELSFCRDRP